MKEAYQRTPLMISEIMGTWNLSRAEAEEVLRLQNKAAATFNIAAHNVARRCGATVEVYPSRAEFERTGQRATWHRGSHVVAGHGWPGPTDNDGPLVSDIEGAVELGAQ